MTTINRRYDVPGGHRLIGASILTTSPQQHDMIIQVVDLRPDALNRGCWAEMRSLAGLVHHIGT